MTTTDDTDDDPRLFDWSDPTAMGTALADQILGGLIDDFVDDDRDNCNDHCDMNNSPKWFNFAAMVKGYADRAKVLTERLPDNLFD